MDKKEPWSFALVRRTWTSLRTRTAPGVLKRFGTGLKKRGAIHQGEVGHLEKWVLINEPEKSWFWLLYAKLPPSRITAFSWQRGLYNSMKLRVQGHSRHITEKARKFQENNYLCFIDYAKVFVWIMMNCGKLSERWEYQTILPVSWEACMWIKKQQLEPCMENWLVQDWLRSTTGLSTVTLSF